MLTATGLGAHLSQFDGNILKPRASRLLPDRLADGGACRFDHPSDEQVQAAVCPTGDSVLVTTVNFAAPEADPIRGDPERLLAEWQKRLWLKIDDDGKIGLLEP